jgi:hypothetical protein
MLVAMLVLMFGALPAMASEITLKKNTNPDVFAHEKVVRLGQSRSSNS